MTNTSTYRSAVQERDILPPLPDASGRPLSWSAAIAGTFAAAAVSFIVIALGSGIGLSFASPYGAGPSVTSLTIAAAVWLVMAQAFAFATGGYLAARLRSPIYDVTPGETTFRDGVQGLVVWTLGVAVIAATLGALALFAAGKAARAPDDTSTSAASRAVSSAAAPVDYFVDLMFRPGSGQQGAQSDTVGDAAAGSGQAVGHEQRAEAGRILVHGVSRPALDDEDRAYLAQLVSLRTGMQADEAQQRVLSVENRAREAVKETADKGAKAGAFFSFWIFMSLLFGGVAATLAGILGGQVRDAEGHFARAPRALTELS